MPAQRCVIAGRRPSSAWTNPRSASWIRRVVLRRRELRVHVGVAEAAHDQAPRLVLMPVVEAVAAVVRQREEAFLSGSVASICPASG